MCMRELRKHFCLAGQDRPYGDSGRVKSTHHPCKHVILQSSTIFYITVEFDLSVKTPAAVLERKRFP